ncbi:MAG: hypothetical protein CL424_14945 [Acidimicrobiaceae bacterium]|nr:hypothetical protein [Acidimicrobiaceae bacterium]
MSQQSVGRTAIIGDAALTGQCVEVAVRSGLEVVLVATTDADTERIAVEHGIPVVDSRVPLADALIERRADVLLSIAHLRLVPPDALAAVTTAINFHDGPLPAYAGLNVTTWAILNGEQQHGVSWHHMTSGVDTGDLVTSRTFEVAADETAFSLNARCFEAALESFHDVVDAIRAGEVPAQSQPDGVRREYRRLDRPVVFIDRTARVEQLERATRALDLGNRIVNGLGAVRLVGPAGFVVVRTLRAGGRPAGDPGALRIIDGDLEITVSDGTVTPTTETPDGRTLTAREALDRLGLEDGGTVPDVADLERALTDSDRELARHEPGWTTVLTSVGDDDTPALASPHGEPATRPLDVAPADLATAVALWADQVDGAPFLTVTDPANRERVALLEPLLAAPVVSLRLDASDSVAELADTLPVAIHGALDSGPFLHDLIGRIPQRRTVPHHDRVTLHLGLDDPDPLVAAGRSGVHVLVGTERWAVVAPGTDAAARAAAQIDAIAHTVTERAEHPLSTMPVRGVLDDEIDARLNDTAIDYDPSTTIDRLIADRSAMSPDAPAVTAGGATITYAEFDRQVRRLASALVAAGVRRGDRIAIAVPRSLDMLRSVVAVLRCGAAYVPLDPTYPPDRLRHMVDDSGSTLVVAFPDEPVLAHLGAVRVVDPRAALDAPDPGPEPSHDGADLAYVIYTSGSTGTPKGVMLEHRNVVNFFAAMDQVIEHERPGVWLAVTSLSFDISVLELLWTLTHGFHVVLSDEIGARSVTTATRSTTMSLFYFAAGEATAADGYRLLLESARWADQHGFEAVWTPERHFHAFGGAYPNPSVTGAALAAVTDRIAIRAGSVVAPLHQPARIAEEWAVVDNLSKGRVGISFAPGWQPNDFVLNPGAYATARDSLPDTIDTIRALWRGETVDLPGHDGEPVAVSTLPRPVQAELPVWLTSAGTPATFERAGTMGVNLLTHLLGQSTEQLAENIGRYRAAWRAAGHEGEGRVTLMLHTFIADSTETAKRVAREPMKQYLSTATGLIKNMASAFPTFAGRTGSGADDAFRDLTDAELDQLLEMAADRYLETSGLFGTVDDAVATIETCRTAGVDEVACLIDFGIDDGVVLASLPLLGEVHDEVERRSAAAAATPAGFAELVARHEVTHLQCTPSLATMLLADPADRAALATIGHVMLGGEALPTAMANELRSLLSGRFTNMYGPTETTIWSLVHEIDGPVDGPVPIGRPIGNNTVHVLDEHGRRRPTDRFGELHIGGAGVARGYHARDELTAERFVDRAGLGRVYATGDIARVRPDGIVEFAGRTDHQVKIRGHRIELGEIEAALDRMPEIVQAIVVAHERGTGEPQLVAFVVPRAEGIEPESVRDALAASMPDAYVPSRIVPRAELPLTPNGKTDRSRLIAEVETALTTAAPDPATDLTDATELLVAKIWVAELGRPVGRDDNFFDIGGNSLLAVTVYRRICDQTSTELALTDVFRYPTVRTFAAHLSSAGRGPGGDEPAAAVDRGARRRNAMRRRHG